MVSMLFVVWVILAVWSRFDGISPVICSLIGTWISGGGLTFSNAGASITTRIPMGFSAPSIGWGSGNSTACTRCIDSRLSFGLVIV